MKEIQDNEIRVIGQQKPCRHHRHTKGWLLVVLAALMAGLAYWLFVPRAAQPPAPVEDEGRGATPLVEEQDSGKAPGPKLSPIGRPLATTHKAYTEMRDTLINDISLRLYIPHHAQMELCVGTPNQHDTTLVFAAQAADVRADNGEIVGAYVCQGEPLSWGKSKLGFCACIEGQVTIGMAENSPLFEQATERGGYFFRQYPLVADGQVVENEPRGKSIRRGLCQRGEEIFMVETGDRESFHDFAQALADLGVRQAIYLVGSYAHGWAVDHQGQRHHFGQDTRADRSPTRYQNYLLWRQK